MGVFSGGGARRIAVAVSVCLGLLALQPAQALRVRAVGLGDMANRAGRIFVGQCVERSVEVDPSTGIPFTTYAFDVTTPIKGVGEGVTLVRVPGTAERPLIPGLSRFEVGETALLVLYPESESGFSTPIGIDQGHFRIQQGHHRVVVSNGRESRQLLVDVPQGILEFGGLDRERTKSLELHEMLRLLQRLVESEGP